MEAMALRSDLSGGFANPRLGLAFAASLALHCALLLPLEWLVPKPQPVAVLSVSLPAGGDAAMLATQPEPELQETPPAAAPPAPIPPLPKPLAGRALETAMAALNREELYPREAIARGIEGRVVLLLTFDDAGRVAVLEIASSSGQPILDNAALKAATRIGRLPGGRRQALLPVEFRLE